MTIKYIAAVLVAVMLLLSGCGPEVISCPPAEDIGTSGSQTTATTARPFTTTTETPTTTTTTTTVVPEKVIPTARELLGQTYGDFLDLTDGVCRLIHARGHTDVAFGLESDAMPHYELPESDAAFKDWEQAASLAGETNLPRDVLHEEQIITQVYVKDGGQVTETLTVGMSVDTFQKHLRFLPSMTVLYDYTRAFNRGFYGRIETTIEGARAYLYVDLTTDRAVQALAGQGIVLGDDGEAWLGKTVSLPELPVGGVWLWLEQRG